MCKMYVVNSLYLGNRSLGLELWDGKGIVEMTEKQVRDGLNSGKEIYGLKVAANGIDLDIDTEDFYMTNLVTHRHIGNYKPMFETDNPVSIMYIVTDMREEKGVRVYDLINSRFEQKTVSEEMLRSIFLMGAICGGAKLEGNKVIMASGKRSTEPEKVENKQLVEKKEHEKAEKTVDKKEVESKSDKTEDRKAPVAKDQNGKAVKEAGKKTAKK